MNPDTKERARLRQMGLTREEVNAMSKEPGPWYIDFQSRMAGQPTRSTRDMALEENLFDRSWAQ